MKSEFLTLLLDFKSKLAGLKKEVGRLNTSQVSKVALRNRASQLADMWVEKIRSPLEHRFKLDRQLITETAEHMKRLHVLSRPNNLKKSYVECLAKVLNGFDDKFILPVQQTTTDPDSVFQLDKLIPALPDATQSEYLKEAIECAQANHSRAAIVMGWCAVIAKIQSKVVALGFTAFNTASTLVKNQTNGKYKRWNKEFKIASEAELQQQVFDTDLIVVVENMGLLDGNESQRLETCFMWRNQSAHPSRAPIDPPHVVAFFTDITKIVLANSKFDI